MPNLPGDAGTRSLGFSAVATLHFFLELKYSVNDM